MRAFLFDLDDTLFDHRHSTRTALAVIREHLSALAALTADALEAQHAIVLEEMHQRVLAGELDVDAARVARFTRLVEMQRSTPDRHEIEAACLAYRAAYASSRRAVAGAVQVLEALRPHGRIAIVSNNVTAEQLGKLQVCGLAGLVDAAVISEEVGIAKPAPEIFEAALARLGAKPADAVMIGDSWAADILGAHAAGITALWFNPWRRPCSDPSRIAGELHAWEPVERTVERILAAYANQAAR